MTNEIETMNKEAIEALDEMECICEDCQVHKDTIRTALERPSVSKYCKDAEQTAKQHEKLIEWRQKLESEIAPLLGFERDEKYGWVTGEACLDDLLYMLIERYKKFLERPQVDVDEQHMCDTNKFKRGDYVRKKGDKGQWHGVICGTYSTDCTPIGYAVESVFERNSVQIYPESALEPWEKPDTIARDVLNNIIKMFFDQSRQEHCNLTGNIIISIKPEDFISLKKELDHGLTCAIIKAALADKGE